MLPGFIAGRCGQVIDHRVVEVGRGHAVQSLLQGYPLGFGLLRRLVPRKRKRSPEYLSYEPYPAVANLSTLAGPAVAARWPPPTVEFGRHAEAACGGLAVRCSPAKIAWTDGAYGSQ